MAMRGIAPLCIFCIICIICIISGGIRGDAASGGNDDGSFDAREGSTSFGNYSIPLPIDFESFDAILAEPGVEIAASPRSRSSGCRRIFTFRPASGLKS
jgi:hypothetical protein